MPGIQKGSSFSGNSALVTKWFGSPTSLEPDADVKKRCAFAPPRADCFASTVALSVARVGAGTTTVSPSSPLRTGRITAARAPAATRAPRATKAAATRSDAYCDIESESVFSAVPIQGEGRTTLAFVTSYKQSGDKEYQYRPKVHVVFAFNFAAFSAQHSRTRCSGTHARMHACTQAVEYRGLAVVQHLRDSKNSFCRRFGGRWDSCRGDRHVLVIAIMMARCILQAP